MLSFSTFWYLKGDLIFMGSYVVSSSRRHITLKATTPVTPSWRPLDLIGTTSRHIMPPSKAQNAARAGLLSGNAAFRLSLVRVEMSVCERRRRLFTRCFFRSSNCAQTNDQDRHNCSSTCSALDFSASAASRAARRRS